MINFSIKQFAAKYWIVLISLLYAIFICFLKLICATVSAEKLLVIIDAIIPTLLIVVASVIYLKYAEKVNKIIKVTLFIVIFLIHIMNTFSTLISLVFAFDIIEQAKLDIEYKNPQEYIQAKESINEQYRIEHFPAQIPSEAKNIHFYKHCNSWFGSERMLLEFDINKEYIDKELKKYIFIKKDKLPKDQDYFSDYEYHKYGYMLPNSNFDIKNFTFYVINNRDNENPPEHQFPYHYGIGVNEYHNRIIYYYDCPD